MLRIFEKGQDSSHFVPLGKGNAKRLLFNVEELVLKHSPTQFSRTFREGDKIFIIQLGSNVHCMFLLISELIQGWLKGSIVISEGKLGRGWRGFGLHLRKTLEASLLQLGHPKNQKGDLKQLALVMVVGRPNNYGIVNKGMEKILEFQISKVKIPMEITTIFAMFILGKRRLGLG